MHIGGCRRLVTVLCVLSSLCPCQYRSQLARITTPASGEGDGLPSSPYDAPFVLFNNGGAIEVSVNDTADIENRDAFRSHLPHIELLSGEGTFDAPRLVHDSKKVPFKTTQQYRNSPHDVPSDKTIPLSSDACAEGTSTNHAAGYGVLAANPTITSEPMIAMPAPTRSVTCGRCPSTAQSQVSEATM